MRIRRSEHALRRVILAAFVLMTACGTERAAATGDVPSWAVAEAARLSIGDSDGADTVVFSSVSDARWHPSGGLVVADGGAFGVRVFDAQGAARLKVGRRGRGPNEFNGGMALAEFAGDSVAVWDAGQMRWSILNVVDGTMRTSNETKLHPAWMHGGVMVYSARAIPPAWALAALTRLSQASSETRIAHIDRAGLLYVSQDAAMRRWHVYRDSVAPLASITLPEGFAPTHFAADAVVGIVSDSVGLQRVAVHALERGSHAAPDTTPAVANPVDEEQRGQLRSSLRNAVTAQEMHWMKGQAYTSAADSLVVAMPEGAEFKILEATPRGWRGVAWFPATGLTCGMIVGLGTPPGWGEGEVNCGWRDVAR